MFRTRHKSQTARVQRGISCGMESLEVRQLLSGGHHEALLPTHVKAALPAAVVKHVKVAAAPIGVVGHGKFTSSASSLPADGGNVQFSLIPAAAQTELNTLSGTTLAATQNVTLGNSNGVETYSVRLTGTGTTSVYTSDLKGNPVTAPVSSTTTVASLPATVSAEVAQIVAVTSLNVSAPAATDTVNVLTYSSGQVVYAVTLPSTSTSKWARGLTVSIDAAGNPVSTTAQGIGAFPLVSALCSLFGGGNATLPLAALPITLQKDFTALAPAGATAGNNVKIGTYDGVTLYTATFTSTGTRTTLTIDENGVLTSLPSSASVALTSIPGLADTELTALATADGATLPTNVVANSEVNGTTVYSAKLSLTGTSPSGNSYTYYVTVSVDGNGDVTVPANDGGGLGDGFCGGGGFGLGGGFGGGAGFGLGGDFG